MADLLKLFDAMQGEIVIADENINIAYVNRAAIKSHEKDGGTALIGQSLLDCHNENSRRIIRELYDKWARGEREVYQYLTYQLAAAYEPCGKAVKCVVPSQNGR